MDPAVAPSFLSAEDARSAVRGSLDALARDDLAAALAAAETALRLRPGYSAGCHALGLAALRLGRLASAIELFERAHEADLGTYEHAEALAISYACAGRLVDSLYYGKLATALRPSSEFTDLLPGWMGTFAEHFRAIEEAPLVARGRTLLARGRADAAAKMFQQEIALDRNSAAAWSGLAEASLAASRPADAVVAYQALCALQPHDAASRTALGLALSAAGLHDEAIVCHRLACDQSSEMAARAGLIAACVAHPEMSRSAIATEIAACVPVAAPARSAASPPPIGGRPLRVGFVSSRLQAGSGLDLFLPMIEARDRSQWHAYLYFDGGGEDALGRRLRNAGTVTDIGEVDDETAALVIGNDGLDALIDLDLHHARWRGALIAAHPAGAVLGWLGLPETAAALGHDAMLGDRWTGTGEDGRSLAVAGGLFCLPTDLAPCAGRPDAEGSPVFAVSATPAQITAQALAAWERILAAVPQASLRLDAVRLGGVAAAEELRQRFAARAVADRVSLVEDEGPAGGSDPIILLDPPGIGGGAEPVLAALRAGNPVVTLPGAIPARRQAASLLGALGLDSLVAGDLDDYVALARRLAEPATGRAVAARIAQSLDEAEALAPAARAAAFDAALRRFLATRGPA
ncbi:MAG: hypothetical protein JO038_08405 [Alphaproteobacteria bacterium]|nr:hypothetical protein [Alphaproteobacteria bacterium]